MATAIPETKLRLKLLIDSKANKVVLAEADKDTVDFLFDILSLSMGTVVQLLEDKGKVGCLRDLYRSVETLNQEYMLPNVTKDFVLKQRSAIDVPLLSLKYAPPATQNVLYTCSSRCNYITDAKGVLCPSCRYTMASLVGNYTYVASGHGYVKEMVKFLVTDNLEVKPMSLSLITSHVKDIASLTEQEVEVGLNEGLAMLEASLNTQSVLTTVFLGKKIKTEPQFEYMRGSLYSSSARGGYVKEIVKFLVTDNLEVKPMSLSLITSHVKDIASLTEKEVEVGLNEGLAILEASLNNGSVLSTVFLGKKIEAES